MGHSFICTQVSRSLSSCILLFEWWYGFFREILTFRHIWTTFQSVLLFWVRWQPIKMEHCIFPGHSAMLVMKSAEIAGTKEWLIPRKWTMGKMVCMNQLAFFMLLNRKDFETCMCVCLCVHAWTYFIDKRNVKWNFVLLNMHVKKCNFSPTVV